MRTRKTALMLTAAACAATAVPSPASAAQKLPRCAEKGSRTLQATRDGRIYARKSTVYACLYKKNRRVKLGHETACEEVPQATGYQLAGRYVGWVRAECGGPEGSGEVVLTDLTTGQIVRSAPAVTTADPNQGSNGVFDFRVNANGSIAWIGTYGSTGPAPSPDDRIQVRKLEAGSPAGGTLVDSGPDIVEDSLALTHDGSGFYYRKGTTPLFATLR
jgi:hypothetical protein